MQELTKTFEINDLKITLSTGKLATLAAGSVLLSIGGTTVLATVTVDKKDSEQDFLPLSIDYIERMYARGAISGSRFQKREGHPSEEAIIKARQVDHSIRSLFPKGFKKATGVVLTVLSYDEINDPEILAVFGASAALLMTGVPFYGPCSSVVGCVDENNNIVINPNAVDREKFKAEFIISAVDGKVLNIEGWAKEVTEDVMDNLLDKSLEYIEKLNSFQREFVKELGIVPAKLDENRELDLPTSKELIEKIKHDWADKIKAGLFVSEKTDRNQNIAELKSQILESLSTETEEVKEFDIHLAVDYVAKKLLRSGVLQEQTRVSGRALEEIRPLSASTDILPTVHGSALFNRGLTQSLSIVTLGSQGKEQIIDDMEGETTKRFMHHYNMPPFSTGESKRYDYRPGRREIGHGAIGENALKHMIPSETEFPYTIRVVSEVLTSNGSTSMAATCASSMALMAAGVPLKEQVAGIGVGLVTEDGNEDNYKLLLDIEGIEDFYGDMDFKVTGTKNGITAIQYENKLRGVKVDILKKAFRLAQNGRMQVLEVMNTAINQPRNELAPTAPVVKTVQIKQDQIGELIGPGGKNIKGMVQDAKDKFGKDVDINIDDDGRVVITASNRDQLEYVENIIKTMFEAAEIGKIYEGVVGKVQNYGAFVDVTTNISGLCHISEVADFGGMADGTKLFREGDRVNVKVLNIDDSGRISFSMKGIEQSEDMNARIEALKEDIKINGGSRPSSNNYRGDRDNNRRFERRDNRR
jgi:polyribonucleotide nucleotidyltransferase